MYHLFIFVFFKSVSNVNLVDGFPRTEEVGGSNPLSQVVGVMVTWKIPNLLLGVRFSHDLQVRKNNKKETIIWGWAQGVPPVLGTGHQASSILAPQTMTELKANKLVDAYNRFINSRGSQVQFFILL